MTEFFCPLFDSEILEQCDIFFVIRFYFFDLLSIITLLLLENNGLGFERFLIKF